MTDDEIWNKRYKLISSNVPIFFNKNLTIKIFEIGKCVNFIRKFCNEPSYSLMKLKQKLTLEIETEEKIRQKFENQKNLIFIEDNYDRITNKSIKIENNLEKLLEKNTRYIKALNFLMRLEDVTKLNLSMLPEIYSEIEVIHKEINKELISIIFKKFKFMNNLNSINRYLLLGQGDMMQYLMDLLFDELKKPANQLYKHNLQSILDTAIRASNAQYHDPDCLKKLNIKLMDKSLGDTGWDIFVMEYMIESPLTVIFSKDLLQKYQILFFFFWKLKRLEFSQNHQIWRNFMNYSHELKGKFENLRPHIHKSMLFNHKIIHFVSTLHNYLTLEVLETQYKRLVEKLNNIEYLDDLIQIHKNFVDSVIEQSLLNPDNSSIYKKILEIFDLILRFRNAQVNFYNYFIFLGSFNYYSL